MDAERSDGRKEGVEMKRVATKRTMRHLGCLLGTLLLGSVAVSAIADDVQDIPRLPSLREQSDIRQGWLEKRLDTVLPELMREYRVDMWIVQNREYNEAPVFRSLIAPTRFAARRRTSFVFFDYRTKKIGTFFI